MAHKKQLITDSLFGTLNDHQLFLIKQSWMHIVNLEELISDIEKRIDVILSKLSEEVQLLITMPGIKKDTAAVIIAEIGVDMGQFPTSKTSCIMGRIVARKSRKCRKEKKKNTKTVKGNPHIKSALCEAAWAVSRSRKQRLGIKYWSLAARRGKKKALVAIGHRMLTIVYHMLQNKETLPRVNLN